MNISSQQFIEYCNNFFSFVSNNVNYVNEHKAELGNEFNSFGMESYFKKEYALAKACFCYAALLGNAFGYRNYLAVNISM